MKKIIFTVLCIFAMSFCSMAGLFSSEVDKTYDRATKYYNEGDMALAFANYMIAAKQGHAKAMAWVGAMYYAGSPGVCEQSYEEAYDWKLKAANAGYTMAFYSLGNYYYKGEGVKKDRVEAMNLWSIAADKNIPCAVEQMKKINPAKKKAYEEYKFSDSIEETLKNMKDPKGASLEKKDGSKDVWLLTRTTISGIEFECALHFYDNKLISVKITGRNLAEEQGDEARYRKGLDSMIAPIAKKYGEPSDVSDFPSLESCFHNSLL